MRRILFVLLVVSASVLPLGGTANAQRVPECLAWNTGQASANLSDRCTQLRIMNVSLQATRAHATQLGTPDATRALGLIEGLVSGATADSEGVAPDIFTASRKNPGLIKFVPHGTCKRSYVYAFNVNVAYSSGIYASNEGLNGSFQQKPTRLEDAPPVVLKGSLGRVVKPAEVFLLTICGGEGGLNVPVQWFRPHTFLIICPVDEVPVFPSRNNDGATLGHHIGNDQVQELVNRVEGVVEKTSHMLVVTVYR